MDIDDLMLARQTVTAFKSETLIVENVTLGCPQDGVLSPFL